LLPFLEGALAEGERGRELGLRHSRLAADRFNVNGAWHKVAFELGLAADMGENLSHPRNERPAESRAFRFSRSRFTWSLLDGLREDFEVVLFGICQILLLFFG
jgi:hypothetical protein